MAHAGALKKILVFKAKQVTKGAAGAPVSVWVDAVTTRGDVTTLGGGKVVSTDERLYIDRRDILVRTNNKIFTDMRLELDGFNYEIIDIVPDKNFGFMRIKMERVNE